MPFKSSPDLKKPSFRVLLTGWGWRAGLGCLLPSRLSTFSFFLCAQIAQTNYEQVWQIFSTKLCRFSFFLVQNLSAPTIEFKVQRKPKPSYAVYPECRSSFSPAFFIYT